MEKSTWRGIGRRRLYWHFELEFFTRSDLDPLHVTYSAVYSESIPLRRGAALVTQKRAVCLLACVRVAKRSCCPNSANR